MNYDSHANNIKVVPNQSGPEACCELCGDRSGCTAFTFFTGSCYLKNSTFGRAHLHGAISGGVGTPPALPPAPPPASKGVMCNQGLRVNGGGQPCLWWSQGCSIGCSVCATDAGGTTPITGIKPHADKIGFRTRCAQHSSPGAHPAPPWPGGWGGGARWLP